MSKDSLDNIDAKLSEMLTNSMHTFDVAMNCLLGDTNLDTVRDDLYATDKAINELHREVRREMIVHSAVNSRNLDIPLLLSYMTMSKDIERIGDYCKNLFEIAETGNTFVKGDDLDEYIELRNDIGKLIVYLQSCLNLDDETKVQDLITLGSTISSDLDGRITSLLEKKEEAQYPVATTLFFRYLKRIVSHIVNASTALIMPTDQIDYLDILDCNDGDHGHPFATNFNPEINIREVTSESKHWEDNQWKIGPALKNKVSFDFPEIGYKNMYLMYHEELESLIKHFPEIKRARFWMTFGDSYLKHLEVLENVGMTSIKPVNYNETEIIPLQFLKKILPDPGSLGERTKGKTCIGTIITGKKDGKEEG